MQDNKKTSHLGYKFVHIFAMAGVFGLTTGLLEGIVFLTIKAKPSWMTWNMRLENVSPEILWVAPIIYFVFFVVLACALALVALVCERLSFIPNVGIEAVAVFLFTWISIYAVSRVPHRINVWVSCILALGVSVQTYRWFRNRQELAIAIMRRSLPVLSVIVITSAVLTTGWERFREGRQFRKLPAPEASAPNVLLIVLDTVRADSLSCYGYPRATSPNIDALVREGVLFENAYAQSNWTLPSHASLMTGWPVSKHNADGPNPTLEKQYLTLAESMTSHGYATCGISANTWWVTKDTGIDRGFLHFEDYFWSISDMVSRTTFGKEVQARVLPRVGYRNNLSRRTAGDVNRALVQWLDSTKKSPFFVFLNYVDAHAPYIAPEPYHTKFMNQEERILEKSDTLRPPSLGKLSSPRSLMLKAAYDGSLSYLDSQIAELFTELRRRDLLNNTLVIIVSDHGESFGEHGMLNHGHSLYREQIHVPLAISWPGRIPSGLRISEPVGISGIPATVTSLLFPDVAQVFPGVSLSTYWSRSTMKADLAISIASEAYPREGTFKGWPIKNGWIKSLVTSRWHFILQQSGKVELYDLLNDPQETEDLANTSVGTPIVEDLKKQLEATLTRDSRKL